MRHANGFVHFGSQDAVFDVAVAQFKLGDGKAKSTLSARGGETVACVGNGAGGDFVWVTVFVVAAMRCCLRHGRFLLWRDTGNQGDQGGGAG